MTREAENAKSERRERASSPEGRERDVEGSCGHVGGWQAGQSPVQARSEGGGRLHTVRVAFKNGATEWLSTHGVNRQSIRDEILATGKVGDSDFINVEESLHIRVYEGDQVKAHRERMSARDRAKQTQRAPTRESALGGSRNRRTV